MISGLTPVPDPGPPPAASGAPNKTAITEMLGGPLKQLTVDDQGRLAVPTLEAWKRDDTAPPVPMTPELADYLKTLHAEFPPPPPPQARQATPPEVPAPGGEDDGGKGKKGDNDDLNPTLKPTLPNGTLFDSRSDFVQQMQAAGCTIAKEATPSAPGEKYTALLVCLAQPEDPWRVLIEAKDDILLKSGHFMGRAGHGSFVVWKNTEAPPDGMSNAWVYNRCSEYKKDIAVQCVQTACGCWPLAARSRPLAAQCCAVLRISKKSLVTISRHFGRTPLRGGPAVSVSRQHIRVRMSCGFQSW